VTNKSSILTKEKDLNKSFAEKRRQAWTEIVENEVAQTAAKLFVQKGYNHTTMDDIADAIGTSKANLYNYVSSKDVLTFKILEHHVKLVADVFNEIDSLPENTSVLEKLRRLIWGYTKVVDKCQNEAIALHHAVVRLDKEGRRKFLKAAAWVFEYFEALLKEGVKSGEFRVHETNLISIDIVQICTRWALLRWYLKGSITLEEYIRRHIGLIEVLLRNNNKSERRRIKPLTQKPTTLLT
jgi:AcrR family transcriptional regulator